MVVSGVRLYGVALAVNNDGGARARDISVLRFRELGALIRQAPYTRMEYTVGDLQAHLQVIHAAFHHGAILPAPWGTVFRSTEQVRRWLAQNYIALSEGIHFVAGRCEVRVHIWIRPGEAGDEPGNVALLGDECFRQLRRIAVAAVPVRRESAHDALIGAFLVEQDELGEFTELVHELQRRHAQLVLEQTGPWPPYDFVRMEFRA